MLNAHDRPSIFPSSTAGSAMSSRRTIPARAPDLTVIVVGWDNPLSTLFAQVERVQDDDDPRGPILLWIGSGFGEVALAEHLAGPLAPYAELTSELVDQLRADRAADADRGPSALQRTNALDIREALVIRQYFAHRRCGGCNPLGVGVIPVGAIFYIQDEGWWRDRYRGAPVPQLGAPRGCAELKGFAH
jgi:hypothetical protein